MLEVLSRSGKELGVFENINLTKSISEIDALALASERLQKEITDTASSQSTLKTETDKATTSVDQHEQSQKRLESTTVSLGDKIQNIGLRFQGFKAILSVLKSTVMDLITTAANTETLGVVVQRMGKTAGYTASEVDKLVSSVQKKGITLAESRDAVIKMIQAELDLSRASDLARLAQNAAVNAQINSSEALGRIIHGMTTFNPLVLRNMGIMVNYDQVFDDHAKTLGKNSKELTNADKTQASFNAVMQAGEKIVGTYEDAMDTAGKRAGSYARYLEALKVSLGDLLLPAFGKVVDIATKFTDWVTNAPTGVRRLILYLSALAVAWTYLNSSMPKSVVAAGAFFSLVQLLPAPIRIVVGAVMALSASMAILATKATIATGGMNILLGVIIAGIALIGEGILSAKSFSEEISELSESVRSNADDIESSNKKLTELRSLYDSLASNTVMTKTEQDKYNEKLSELAELYPSIVTGIDSSTGAYLTNADAVRLVISAEEDHLKVKHEKYLYDLADGLIKVSKESKSLQKEYDGLVSQAESYEQTIRLSNDAISDLEQTLASATLEQIANSGELQSNERALESWKRTLADAKSNLSDTRRKLSEIQPELQKTTAYWKDFIAQAMKTNSLPQLFTMLKMALGDTKYATQLLAQAFKQLSVEAIMSMMNIVGNAQQMALAFAIISKAKKELEAGFPGAGMLYLKQLELIKSGFTVPTNKTETPTPPAGSKTGSSKEKDKEVLNALQEQLKTLKEIDNELQLNAGFQGTVNGLLDRRLQLLRDMYYTITGIKVAEEMMLNDYIKVVTGAVPPELSGLMDIDELLKGVDIKEMSLKAVDKVADETLKRFTEISNLQASVNRDITEKKIDLIEDEFDRRRAEIDLTYQIEIGYAMQLKDITDAQRDALLDLARKKQAQDLRLVDEEAFIAPFNRAEGIANNIQGIFNFGAHTVYAHFLKALQITQQIITLFQTLESLGALKWLGSLLGSIFGFAIGGPAGAAAGAGIGGGALGGMPGFGGGSFVERNPVMTSNMMRSTPQKVYIDAHVHGKIDGHDLRLLQRRVDRIENRREN
ncbi:MAG: hypothetical protein UZ04_CHB001001457 [Chlorobi bacterium OLB4]|jgi:hypothetical protein|nr:MAG: hypothetical protein UZ04_CHB001001457 [Chlorobi bacterium OLB4]RIK47791.1 MAG: hypothetical protein DCC60_09465 [Ignavibacteriota bacterium]